MVDNVLQCITNEDESMALSLRLTKKELELIKKFAELHGMSVSDLIRTSVFEKIDDVLDLASVEQAYQKYLKNPKTLSFDEIKLLVGE
jgi:RHH-type transcriptional regulator, rel operon repressor / antitoxin RelB